MEGSLSCHICRDTGPHFWDVIPMTANVPLSIIKGPLLNFVSITFEVFELPIGRSMSLINFSLKTAVILISLDSSVVEHLTSDAGVSGLNSRSNHIFSFVFLAKYIWYVYIIVYIHSSYSYYRFFKFLYRNWQYLESIHVHVRFIIQCVYFINTSLLALNSFYYNNY